MDTKILVHPAMKDKKEHWMDRNGKLKRLKTLDRQKWEIEEVENIGWTKMGN